MMLTFGLPRHFLWALWFGIFTLLDSPSAYGVNAPHSNACLNLTVDDILARSPRARAQLLSEHMAIVDVSMLPLDVNVLKQHYFAEFSGARHNDGMLGDMRPIDVNNDYPHYPVHVRPKRVAGRTGEGLVLLTEAIMNISQKTFPKVKLLRDNMYLSVGFNAANSRLHRDAIGTFLHVFVAVEGESTVVFPEAVLAKINFDLTKREKAYIVGKDKDENLTIKIAPSYELPGRTIILSRAEYIQPPAGHAVIIAGESWVEFTKSGVAPLHASPYYPDTVQAKERVTVNFGISPEQN